MDGKTRPRTYESLREGGPPRNGIRVLAGELTVGGATEYSACALSEDEKYRYLLIRQWNLQKPCALWVMLNPSTATHTEDDATIRKFRGFSHRWGLGGFVVVNLFAFRSRHPRHLLETDDPIGSVNDTTIAEQAARAERIICAWGAQSSLRDRGRILYSRSETVKTIILERKRRDTPMLCLGRAKDGMPRHPLMLSYATEAESYT
jgi:hypothetical protein